MPKIKVNRSKIQVTQKKNDKWRAAERKQFKGNQVGNKRQNAHTEQKKG